jgi:hypothetical protein
VGARSRRGHHPCGAAPAFYQYESGLWAHVRASVPACDPFHLWSDHALLSKPVGSQGNSWPLRVHTTVVRALLWSGPLPFRVSAPRPVSPSRRRACPALASPYMPAAASASAGSAGAACLLP